MPIFEENWSAVGKKFPSISCWSIWSVTTSGVSVNPGAFSGSDGELNPIQMFNTWSVKSQVNYAMKWMGLMLYSQSSPVVVSPVVQKPQPSPPSTNLSRNQDVHGQVQSVTLTLEPINHNGIFSFEHWKPTNGVIPGVRRFKLVEDLSSVQIHSMRLRKPNGKHKRYARLHGTIVPHRKPPTLHGVQTQLAFIRSHL